MRKYKHDAGLALNAPLGKVTIYAPHTINDEGDTGRTLNAEVHWRTDVAKLDRVITDIEFNRSVIGPAFRKQAGAFMAAVRALSPAQSGKPAKDYYARRCRDRDSGRMHSARSSPTWRKARRWT